MDILASIQTDSQTNCSCADTSGFCSKPNLLKTLRQFCKTNEIDLEPENELEILKSSEFQAYVKGNGVSDKELSLNIKARFKKAGPRNTTEWLDNRDIYETLLKWAHEFDFFYPLNFSFSDIYEYNSPLRQHNLKDILSGKIPLDIFGVKRLAPHKCIACVINTDVHTGSGIHWCCIFIDARHEPTTIEFFNSSGKPPMKSVAKFMFEAQEQLPNSKQIIVSNIQHQHSSSECGVYCMFYIRARLEGFPPSRFSDKKNIIPDKVMLEFRKHMFI